MKIIKEGIEEKGRDYIGPSYGYDYEPQYFAVCDEAGEPVDVFMGTEEEFEAYFNDAYDNSYSWEELSEDEYFDTADMININDDFEDEEIPFTEAVEEEDPKVTKFKEYYRKITGLDEATEITADTIDSDAFKMACNNLGWNYDSARTSVLKETWKPLTEEDVNE